MFFMLHSLEILNVFDTLTLKQIFSKTQILSKKLEYRFLVEGTKNENETFPNKTSLSVAKLRQIEWEYKMNLSRRTEFCQ